VNISVGSFFTTIGAEGTIWCALSAKKAKKARRISLSVIFSQNAKLGKSPDFSIRIVDFGFCAAVT